jgi:hypothetical protein
MTHHSGLPSDLVKGMWSRRPEPFEEEVRLLRDEYIAYPTDHVFSYSNVGVTVLGQALETVADRDFSSHMALSLFLPLKMTNSSFAQAPDRSPMGSKAYRNDEETEEPALRSTPAGGLNTTVLDLSRFMSMVFARGWAGDHQVLKAETLAEMLRPQNSGVGLDLSFRIGLGWILGGPGEVDIRNAGLVAHHNGATINHRSQLIVLPDQKLGVVVLSNSASAGALVSRVAAETLKLALEAKAGITQPEPGAPDKAAPLAPEEKVAQQPALPPGGVDVPRKPQAKGGPQPEEKKKGPLTPEQLAAFEGRYATPAGVVPVTSHSDYLVAELPGRSVRLVPRPDGLLGLNYRLLGLFPLSLGELDRVGIGRDTVEGHDIIKAVIDGKEILVGERLRPGPIPEKWLGRLGAYEIVNPGDDTVLVEKMRLRNDNGLLVVEYAMPLFMKETMTLALAPLSDTEAVISGLGRGRGETIKVVTKDGEDLLAYGGYVLKRRRE